MTRRSLRDRNRDAIARDPQPPAEAPSSTPPGPPEPVEEPKAAPAPGDAAKEATPQRTATAPGAGETARVGIYLSRAQFEEAKGAYLADWAAGGEADTFSGWIAAAIEAHAARTPAQRATAEPRGRAEQTTGVTRSFVVPADTAEKMRAAIGADQQAGRWPSMSAWCGEAVERAVEAARTQAGGTLPTPPARLPNRLVR